MYMYPSNNLSTVLSLNILTMPSAISGTPRMLVTSSRSILLATSSRFPLSPRIEDKWTKISLSQTRFQEASVRQKDSCRLMRSTSRLRANRLEMSDTVGYLDAFGSYRKTLAALFELRKLYRTFRWISKRNFFWQANYAVQGMLLWVKKISRNALFSFDRTYVRLSGRKQNERSVNENGREKLQEE